MLWYDCRRDPLVSTKVKQGMELIKSSGLYDNSVIVLTSDHGYPDPRSGLTESSMRKARHDMVVTDDNIRVPLMIRYPGCRPQKVETMVGLIDLFPTVLKLLAIDSDDPRLKNVRGQDLSDLMQGLAVPWSERVIRSDTRLTLAPGRITSLRTNEYKYVYFHDETAEALFDLERDPLELKNLLESPSEKNEPVRSKFHNEFHRLQDELYRFHQDALEAAFHRNVEMLRGMRLRNILFLSVAPLVFLEIISSRLRETFPGITIDVLPSKRGHVTDKMSGLFDHVLNIDGEPLLTANRLRPDKRTKYDASLVITEKSSIGFDDPAAYAMGKSLSKKVLLVDYNMRFYNRFLSRAVWPIRKYRRHWVFYRQEPSLLLRDLVKLARNGVKLLILKKQIETPDMEKTKKMRDRALKAEEAAADQQRM